MTPLCIEADEIELFMTSTGYIAFDCLGIDADDALYGVFSAQGPLQPRSICDFLDETLSLVANYPDAGDVTDLESLLSDLKLCVQKTEAALSSFKEEQGP